jgi:hypothetical protein
LTSTYSAWVFGIFETFQRSSSIFSTESAAFWDFPVIFENFKKHQFTLLWRGSRDGFGVRAFHERCDGHANTLTLILDTDGNIFGGFTPVEWESRVSNGKSGDENNCFKADPSQKSFLFTLKNSHSIPARRFVLKADKQHRAIYCSSTCSPVFWDLGVRDNCNANTNSCGFFNGTSEDTYANDTPPGAKMYFANSQQFQVKEIEVFEIIDSLTS